MPRPVLVLPPEKTWLFRISREGSHLFLAGVSQLNFSQGFLPVLSIYFYYYYFFAMFWTAGSTQREKVL